jgi:diguanylate cyclase (GGDEF)-like protein
MLVCWPVLRVPLGLSLKTNCKTLDDCWFGRFRVSHKASLRMQQVLLKAAQYFDKQSKPLLLVVGLANIPLFGLVDYLTGHEAFFAFIYLLPITFVVWQLGQRWGIIVSVLCAATWVLANSAAGWTYSHPWIFVWNTFSRFAVFLIVTMLLSALRAAHEHEKALARTDYLTGAVNKRSFCDLVELEISRCRRYRHPFTVIYADLDNFKAVNDQMGHSTGDSLLCEVVAALKRELRETDTVARLGGDEFALLLPETGQGHGQTVARRLRQSLLEAMQTREWPVSSSFGVLTCVDAPASVDKLLHMADQLMYAVKQGGKDGIRHEYWSPSW